MYAQFRKKLILVSSIVLAMAAIGSAAATDTAAQNVTDARQETQIWTTYALNSNLRASDLKVSVRNGKATLTGTVEEDVNKDLAKQIALGVKGITDVDNQIVVQSDYVAPARSSDRSFGDVIEDATITSTVKSKLLWSKHTDGMTANVDTSQGKVTLQGTADSKAAKDFAGRLAMNTRGVVSVDNQLVVSKDRVAKDRVAKIKNPSDKPSDAEFAKNEAGKDVSDGWITTKVKSTFLYSRNVDGTDIKVDTNGGVVTLSGKVDSSAERALAIELAQNVRGVKSVRSKGLTH